MNNKTRTARTPSPKATSGRHAPTRRKNAGADKPAASRRRFYVSVSLITLLSGTSALLLALAPAPLKPDTSASLFALDVPRSMDVIFDTANPVTEGRWKYIYVHHSQTTSGNAATLGTRPGGLADHFVIGNGAGCVDGEIQVGHRWAAQIPAGKTIPSASIRADCISICVVGDFNRSAPTPTQRLRLSQLVATLQGRLGIAGSAIHLIQGTGTAADAGQYFPADSFRQQLLP